MTELTTGEPPVPSSLLRQRATRAANLVPNADLRSYFTAKAAVFTHSLESRERSTREAERGIHHAMIGGQHQAEEFSAFLETAGPEDIQNAIQGFLDEDITRVSQEGLRVGDSLKQPFHDDKEYLQYDKLVQWGKVVLPSISDPNAKEYVENSINQFRKLRNETARFKAIWNLQEVKKNLGKLGQLKQVASTT